MSYSSNVGQAWAGTAPSGPAWTGTATPPSAEQNQHGNIICRFCQRTVHTMNSLLTHFKLCHYIQEHIPCPLCTYTALTKDRLRNHIQRTHIGEIGRKKPPLPCTMCQQWFHGLDPLVSHLSSKHTQPGFFPCHLCTDYTLTPHASRQHLYHQHKICSVCMTTNGCAHCRSSCANCAMQPGLTACVPCNKGEVFMCPHCVMVLGSWQEMKLHIHIEHPDDQTSQREVDSGVKWATTNAWFDVEYRRRSQNGPVGANPMPFGANALPFGANPMPFGTYPMPFGANPMPFGANPVSIGANPMSFGAIPVSIGANPVSLGANPMPLDVNPVVVDASKVPFNTDVKQEPSDHVYVPNTAYGHIPFEPRAVSQEPIASTSRNIVPNPSNTEPNCQKPNSPVTTGASRVPNKASQVLIGASPKPKNGSHVPNRAHLLSIRERQALFGIIQEPKNGNPVLNGSRKLPNSFSIPELIDISEEEPFDAIQKLIDAVQEPKYGSHVPSSAIPEPKNDYQVPDSTIDDPIPNKIVPMDTIETHMVDKEPTREHPSEVNIEPLMIDEEPTREHPSEVNIEPLIIDEDEPGQSNCIVTRPVPRIQASMVADFTKMPPYVQPLRVSFNDSKDIAIRPSKRPIPFVPIVDQVTECTGVKKRCLARISKSLKPSGL